jgi:tungstate transport system permease protein
MDFIWDGFLQALALIINLDPELINITSVSLKISFVSTTIATLSGVPLGFLIGINDFYGKRLVATLLNTLMALPTVVVGLFLYSLLSRRGPLGSCGLLFTPTAMIIGQVILATPIIAALTMSAVANTDRRIRLTAATLGANGYQTMLTIFGENRFAIIAAIIAGFGRVFAEVGVSMMLGGNIKLYTRNITTALALETSKGEFALGIALGIILLAIACFINLLFHWFQGRK